MGYGYLDENLQNIFQTEINVLTSLAILDI